MAASTAAGSGDSVAAARPRPVNERKTAVVDVDGVLTEVFVVGDESLVSSAELALATTVAAETGDATVDSLGSLPSPSAVDSPSPDAELEAVTTEKFNSAAAAFR